jgi:acetyl esterase/lipase
MGRFLRNNPIMTLQNFFSAAPRRGVLRALGVSAAGLGFLSACSPLKLLNAVSPDEGVEAAATGIAYGPHPRQKLDIYTPPESARAAPVVVFFYGGGWEWGSREDYAFIGRAFAAKGYVTVLPDYRLVPEVRFPAFVEDSAAAVAWVAANIKAHGGDPARLAVAGHSAGAYNAMMLALDRSYLAAAGAAPGAVGAVLGLAGPYDFLPLEDPLTIAAFGTAEDLAATQPVNFVRADAPPALLIHGARDRTVYPRNQERLAAALRRAGAPLVEAPVYEEADHAALVMALSPLFRGRAPVLEDCVAFLERTLG